MAAGVLPLLVAPFFADESLRARIAMSGMGLVLLAVGIARPRFAWRYDIGWRGLLGDRLYAAMFAALGSLIFVYAWVAKL
jgi:hypothetical protein